MNARLSPRRFVSLIASLALAISMLMSATAAFALVAETKPVAVDDAYTTVQETTLTVVAPGLLGNDVEPADGYLAWVNWRSTPQHGTLRVGLDGHFTYVPEAGWSGVDHFRYTTVDSEGRVSDPATATVTVLAKTSLSAPSGTRVRSYPVTTTIEGTLTVSGLSAEGLTIHLLEAADNGITFVDSQATTTTADGHYSFVVTPSSNHWYKPVFYSDGVRAAATGSTLKVGVKPWVSRPYAPSTVGVNRNFTVYGYIKPHVWAGEAYVHLNLWKKNSSGVWKLYGSPAFTITSNYNAYTKYSRIIKLPSKGQWRINGYFQEDAEWTSAPTQGYCYITVK